MRICLACDHELTGDDWRCRRCGFAPQLRDGFPCFAPELADENQDYDRECFAAVSELGAENFWRAARSRLILWALGRYLDPRSTGSFLEIGCGLGFILKAIEARFPDLRLTGTDIYVESLGYSRQLLPAADLFQADALKLPFRSEFDVIGAFDVIEHIEDDAAALRQIFQSARPGGGILITVPQHPFLWSQRDENLCHKRRYTRSELVEKVTAAGFAVVRVTSFFTIPFPAMVISNLRNRSPREDYDPHAALRVSATANSLLGRILNFERALIKAGCPMPFGGSLFLVAHKREAP